MYAVVDVNSFDCCDPVIILARHKLLDSRDWIKSFMSSHLKKLNLFETIGWGGVGVVDLNYEFSIIMYG